MLSEKEKLYKREYYQAHREEILAKQKEYKRKYYQKNKEKIKEKNEKYRNEHLEKYNEWTKKWIKNNPEKAKESCKKAHEKFKEKVDWNEYCKQAKKRRIERLKAKGCLNISDVISGRSKPIYEEDNNEQSTTRG